ncbi:putative Protein phosphatase 2C [Blattamonas nauphoetae]|uniref:PPM-type phosphatase domain-containing protein n=1 Tax=Blattamonas nauphoetae TaxID=2049346 RepID=A0ABQ9X1J0_9EUKA|nr:putative Protein phosphatase 2C [Blattamonas nauphoetae]
MSENRDTPTLTMSDTASFYHPTLGTVICSGHSICGDGRYSYNQDRFLIRPNFVPSVPGSVYLSITDGHGSFPFTADRSGGAISEYVTQKLFEHTQNMLTTYFEGQAGFHTEGQSSPQEIPPLNSSPFANMVSPPGSIIYPSKSERKHLSRITSRGKSQLSISNSQLHSQSPQSAPRHRIKTDSQEQETPHDVPFDESKIEQILKDAFSETNEELRRHLDDLNLLDKCAGGCTATVCVLLNRTLFVASLGDSPAALGFYTESEVSLLPLSRKHHWCWADENSRILQHNGEFICTAFGSYLVDEHGENCLSMSRAFGDFEYEPSGLIHTPDICRQRIEPWREFVVLLESDGVSDVISLGETVRMTGQWYNKVAAVQAESDKEKENEKKHPDEKTEAEVAESANAIIEKKERLASRAARSIVIHSQKRWIANGTAADTDNITSVVMFFPHVPLLTPAVAMTSAGEIASLKATVSETEKATAVDVESGREQEIKPTPCVRDPMPAQIESDKNTPAQQLDSDTDTTEVMTKEEKTRIGALADHTSVTPSSVTPSSFTRPNFKQSLQNIHSKGRVKALASEIDRQSKKSDAPEENEQDFELRPTFSIPRRLPTRHPTQHAPFQKGEPTGFQKRKEDYTKRLSGAEGISSPK